MPTLFDPTQLGVVRAPNRILMAPMTGIGDAVAFGRAFISNPHLPRRPAEQIPLVKANRAPWFTQGAEGYIDCPSAA
jgi:2,4-dienoyl-CoA reductase-like NADH-dependent reductase (Old Yellow Enzyme family)